MRANKKKMEDKIDALVEDVAADIEQQQDVDKKFQVNEQCLSAMSTAKAKKMWVCAGSFFIQMPKNDAEKLIRKDQKELQAESVQLQQHLTKAKQQLALLDPKGEYHDAAFLATLK